MGFVNLHVDECLCCSSHSLLYIAYETGLYPIQISQTVALGVCKLFRISSYNHDHEPIFTIVLQSQNYFIESSPVSTFI